MQQPDPRLVELSEQDEALLQRWIQKNGGSPGEALRVLLFKNIDRRMGSRREVGQVVPFESPKSSKGRTKDGLIGNLFPQPARV